MPTRVGSAHPAIEHVWVDRDEGLTRQVLKNIVDKVKQHLRSLAQESRSGSKSIKPRILMRAVVPVLILAIGSVFQSKLYDPLRDNLPDFTGLSSFMISCLEATKRSRSTFNAICAPVVLVSSMVDFWNIQDHGLVGPCPVLRSKHPIQFDC
ncbi:hypothetical protein JAAARDRAFT_405188 [Jaapia argillacea MUCL 33604]|uniref:Uncharacterized protein n=1 Tax=Jaapia argillacea MUCL 33604 TaxID=933084 RepID=A0A067PHC9_9AGAM|nr:hypothetical protein JAAARDRAFT_405188 [Jaapia argillacea MUCL 33604]